MTEEQKKEIIILFNAAVKEMNRLSERLSLWEEMMRTAPDEKYRRRAEKEVIDFMNYHSFELGQQSGIDSCLDALGYDLIKTDDDMAVRIVPHIPSAVVRSVVYFWYDHLELRSNGDAEKVAQAIAAHDLEEFNEIKKKYEPNSRGWVYFPKEAFVYEGDEIVAEIDITTPSGFAQVTEQHYECG